MNVNAGNCRGILPQWNQMETVSSSNGDQMGPSAAESFLVNFACGGPRGGGYPFEGKFLWLGILNTSLIMKARPLNPHCVWFIYQKILKGSFFWDALYRQACAFWNYHFSANIFSWNICLMCPESIHMLRTIGKINLAQKRGFSCLWLKSMHLCGNILSAVYFRMLN